MDNKKKIVLELFSFVCLCVAISLRFIYKEMQGQWCSELLSLIDILRGIFSIIFIILLATWVLTKNKS